MIVQTPICSTGYGQTGYNIVKQLDKLGENVIIVPIGNPDPELYKDIAHLDWRNRDEGYLWADTSIKIWHQIDLHTRVGRGRNIGFPFFELNKFTTEEKISLSSCDKIFVCSKWAKGIIKDQINRNASVIPLGVDRSIFHENSNVKRSSTIFFNCGKWEVRKGHDFLIEAFNRAFSPTDNVELWMMCDNQFIGEGGNNNWKNHYKNTKMGGKVRFIPWQKSHKDVYSIMRQVDCGVFPARAEGWNLELLELLSCGKHVIATDYAGHTEYISRNNANLINTDNLELAHDGVWFNGQGEWASLKDKQMEQTVEYMKSIHDLKEDNDLHLNIAGIETAIKFSWENTAKEIINEYRLE